MLSHRDLFRHSTLLAFALATLFLAACAAPAPTSPPTPLLTGEGRRGEVATATPLPSATPTLTPPPTATPTLTPTATPTEDPIMRQTAQARSEILALAQKAGLDTQVVTSWNQKRGAESKVIAILRSTTDQTRAWVAENQNLTEIRLPTNADLDANPAILANILDSFRQTVDVLAKYKLTPQDVNLVPSWNGKNGSESRVVFVAQSKASPLTAFYPVYDAKGDIAELKKATAFSGVDSFMWDQTANELAALYKDSKPLYWLGADGSWQEWYLVNALEGKMFVKGSAYYDRWITDEDIEYNDNDKYVKEALNVMRRNTKWNKDAVINRLVRVGGYEIDVSDAAYHAWAFLTT